MKHDKRDSDSSDIVRPDRHHKKGLAFVLINVITAAVMIVKELRNKDDFRKY